MRRETFSTTGPRMTVRFFGGYDFADADAAGDLAKAGYAKGVPMGGDMKPAPAGKPATFLIAAMKDPDGANLDRVQVIKGWLGADGKTQERVYEVKWAGDRKPGPDGKLPPIGSTVDMSQGDLQPTALARASLMARWTDPDFHPEAEGSLLRPRSRNPDPALDGVRSVAVQGKDACECAAWSHQERAFTSPIWYSPAG